MKITEVFSKVGEKRKVGKLIVELINKTEVVVTRPNGRYKLIDMKMSLINMPLEIHDKDDKIELTCRL